MTSNINAIPHIQIFQMQVKEIGPRKDVLPNIGFRKLSVSELEAIEFYTELHTSFTQV